MISGSVALLADAMHMLSDAAGLIIAMAAVLVGKRAATSYATYGYRRVEVLAAMEDPHAEAVLYGRISGTIVVRRVP